MNNYYIYPNMYIENNQLKILIYLACINVLDNCLDDYQLVGLTRLTDSGLSITTWELFAGSFTTLEP